MSETGFAIWCPHCFQWSDWPDVHSKICSAEEQRVILEALRDGEKYQDFSHEKMFRCKDPSGLCPLRFQAFLFKDQTSAHQFVEKVPTWTLGRAFRLYKRKDQPERWENYSGAIFCMNQTPRHKNIELESLLDRQFVSRAIVGMSLEIDDAFTIYAAKSFKTGLNSDSYKMYWVRVESYEQEKKEEEKYVPPRYNPFCKICRIAEINALLEKFKDRVNKDNCYLRDKIVCRDNEEYCKKEDWSHCPAFLNVREQDGICYKCDLKLIKELRSRWVKKELIPPGYWTNTCWAGFTEIAAPIVVQNHLIAVVMTGQLVIKDKTILPSVDSIVEGHPILQPHRQKLKSLYEILMGHRDPENDLEKHAKRFCIDESQFKKKAESIVENANRIADIANARYREIRYRSESLFKEELVGRIDINRESKDFFKQSVLTILPRMREFWSFQAVYLTSYEILSKQLSVLAVSKEGLAPQFFVRPVLLGKIDENFEQAHPQPWLYDMKEKNVSGNRWINKFKELFEQAREPENLGIPIGRCYFLVVIPCGEQIYTFVFAARDNRFLSPLNIKRGQVSQICQESILETCWEILGELKYREEHEKKVKLDAWHSFSAQMAHNISNWLFAIRGALRRQKEKKPKFVGIENIEYSMNMIGAISKELVEFSTEKRLKFISVDLVSFIRKEFDFHKNTAQGQILNLIIPDSLPQCTWDVQEMKQVIAELMTNAIYFTPSGGTISVSVQLFTKDDSEIIKLIVENKGLGVEYAEKKHIFEPFVSNRPDSTGLGLSIVDKIIKNHGGTIYEDGQPGKNAKFIIELPVNSQKEVSL